MKQQKVNELLPVLIFGILFGFSTINGQTSAYHSIVFPYESGYSITSDGMNNSFAGHAADVNLNPGGLAFITKGYATAIYNIENISHKFNYEYGNDPEKRWHLDNYPAILSVAFPFEFNENKFVLGFSGRYIPSPEFKLPERMQWDELTRIEHSSNGDVWNANLALSTFLTENLGIGINISRWFGSWDWDDYINAENYGSGTFNYSGANLSIGAFYQISRFKIGLALHSPFTLMTGSNLEIQSWYVNAQNRNIEQKFDGAGRLELAYELTPTTQLSIGYRLQGKIHIKNYFPEDTVTPYKISYGKSHQYTAVVIQEIRWNDIRLPVFAGYQLTSLPETDNSNLSDYQQINGSKNGKPQHVLSAGINAVYQSVGLYFAGRWTHGQVSITNNSTPPYS